jgi:HlyD family secretion protein
VARLIALVVALALGAAAALYGLPDLTPRSTRIPTTRPQRGDVPVEVHALGDLRALRSTGLTAPPVGGTLQLVRLLPAGTFVKQGDLVMAFDLEEQQYNLAQARSELLEAEQEIVKLAADARVQTADDAVALLKARYALRRAELQVAGNEFVGTIEARKNELSVDEARRVLAQLEDDARTHAESTAAGRAVLEERRRKAQIASQLAERHIESMTVRAPMDGLVVIKENRNATGGFFTTGMTLPDFREGDTVQPGTTVAEVVDVRELEIRARVPETDRPSVGDGAPASVNIEAVPGSVLAGSTKGVGGLASRNFWDTATARQFDAAFALDRPVETLRPGMTARIVVRGESLKDVTHLPRQVLFEKSGKPVVYVREGSGFKPVEVQVQRVTESRVVLAGLPPDADVALADPDAARGGANGPETAPPIPGGAR